MVGASFHVPGWVLAAGLAAFVLAALVDGIRQRLRKPA
jgi:hypothetical protein